jgi:hypothetical protein
LDKSRILGFSGAVLLALGAFLPIVNLPIVGSMNYFNNGQGDGVFIVLLAVGAGLLTWFKLTRFLWIPGAISLVMLSVALTKFVQVIAEAKSKLESTLANNPFAGLAQGFLNSVQLQWGWVVLFLGAAVLVLASFVKNPAPLTQTPGAATDEAGTYISDEESQEQQRI